MPFPTEDTSTHRKGYNHRLGNMPPPTCLHRKIPRSNMPPPPRRRRSRPASTIRSNMTSVASVTKTLSLVMSELDTSQRPLATGSQTEWIWEWISLAPSSSTYYLPALFLTTKSHVYEIPGPPTVREAGRDLPWMRNAIFIPHMLVPSARTILL
jgi:hypothetical protein